MAIRDPLRPIVQGDQLTVSAEAASGNPAGLTSADAPTPDLQQIIGHQFTSSALLTEALTHPSALVPERGRGRRAKVVKHGYERLEFLGDRVLGLVVAEMLWHRFPDEPEGMLTRRLTHLVRRETLARVAAAIGLGDYLTFSRAERAAGAAANPAILADACEALIAAIYLDGGFDAASSFVHRFWEPLLAAMNGPPRDPKTTLQEWAQARGLGLPRYELVATAGPDHAPLFTVAASIAGNEAATATASSKRIAEAGAAAALLERLVGGG
jgi:ribonuclease III